MKIFNREAIPEFYPGTAKEFQEGVEALLCNEGETLAIYPIPVSYDDWRADAVIVRAYRYGEIDRVCADVRFIDVHGKKVYGNREVGEMEEPTFFCPPEILGLLDPVDPEEQASDIAQLWRDESREYYQRAVLSEEE